jgi:transcriptional regulator with XRE-family HTH domain
VPTRPPRDPGSLTLAVAALLAREVGDQGLTQTKLAGMSGISQPMISLFLRGLAEIDLDELDVLCSALGLDVVDVVARADEARRA